ncbi:MAG: helix-turn-helix transcriptional regulator [Stenotrophomonas sp.]
MAKRSDTLETVILALELLRRIPRSRKITARELHQQLEQAGIQRELRTIQRQLELLSTHFDIERDDRDKPYGYRWLENSSALVVPSLSAQESLLLHLAEEHLNNLLPTRLMKSMEGFFAQARRNLSQVSDARLERQWPEKVRVVATSQPLLPPKIAPGVMEAASDALYRNHWLHLDYRNSQGKRGKAEVMPLGLAQQGQRLYLVCRYRGYDNERSLALHRILSAEISTIPFDRPKDFNFKRYDDDGRFGFGKGERIKLSFQITRSAGLQLLETPLSHDQKVVELESGRLQITATVVDSLILRRWLRGFGDAVDNIHQLSVATTPLHPI